MSRPWIAEVTFDSIVLDKLARKHAIMAFEVVEAVTLGAAISTRWHDHPIYGRRLLVRGSTLAGRQLLVVLSPSGVSDGRWECKTAIQWTR